MKKIVIAPDSFKGSLSAVSFCQVARQTIRQALPRAQAVCLLIADGGEGTLDCFRTALGAQTHTVMVRGPWGEPRQAQYVSFGSTAVIELAQAAGLPLVKERPDPGHTTTYGVGQLMARAVRDGFRELLLGLGGSCTNDAGTGAACAMGVRFWNRAGELFVPTGLTLGDIAGFDCEAAHRLLKDCRVTAMCDVSCKFWEAARIFAPQKGADPAMTQALERNLLALQPQLGQAAQAPGSGAAGGFGAAVTAFFGGSLRPGIELALDTVGFDRALEGASLVITGEGSFDRQSLRGKAVSGVIDRAGRRGVPVLVLAGRVEPGMALPEGVAVRYINRPDESLEHACRFVRQNLARAISEALERMPM